MIRKNGKWSKPGRNFFKGRLFSEFLHYKVDDKKIAIYRQPMFCIMSLNHDLNRWRISISGKSLDFVFNKRYEAKRFVENNFEKLLKYREFPESSDLFHL